MQRENVLRFAHQKAHSGDLGVEQFRGKTDWGNTTRQCSFLSPQTPEGA